MLLDFNPQSLESIHILTFKRFNIQSKYILTSVSSFVYVFVYIKFLEPIHGL